MAVRQPTQDETGGLILTDLADGVGTITLNRPDRHNALNDTMSEGMRLAVDWAVNDPEVRVIVLRGAGRSFSSGRDTRELGHRDTGVSDIVFIRKAQHTRLQILDCTKPVVAEMKGAVLGGALEMALSADFRVCADDARMGFPESDFAIGTDTGGGPLTTMLAGPSRAKWLIMTAERIDAQQALAWGMVDWVVPRGELEAKTAAVAAKLASRAPLAMSLTKQTVDALYGPLVRTAIRTELLAESVLFRSDDRNEAINAAREGRAPQFRGT